MGDIVDWVSTSVEACRCLRTLGCLDISDVSFRYTAADGPLEEDSAWRQVSGMTRDLGRLTDRSLAIEDGSLQEAMKEAGLENIREVHRTIMVGDYFDYIWDRIHSTLLVWYDLKHVSAEDVHKELQNLQCRLLSEVAVVRTE